MRSFSALIFGIALLGSTPAALAKASVPVTISFNFDQTFAFVACPAGTPAGYVCLNVTGHQSSSLIGDVSFQRIVFVNENGYNPSDPLCLPDETSGTLTAGSNQMTFRAAGNVCFVDGTAAYNVVITGGRASSPASSVVDASLCLRQRQLRQGKSSGRFRSTLSNEDEIKARESLLQGQTIQGIRATGMPPA